MDLHRPVSRLLAPLAAPDTYRRWGFLVLGGATYWPYVVAAAVVASMTTSLAVRVAVCVLLAGVAPVATAWIPLVRTVEGSAARVLVGGPIATLPTPPATTWPDRWRTVGFFLAHLLIGMAVSLLTMIVLTGALELALVPLTTRPLGVLTTLGVPEQLPGAGTWRGLWTLPLALLLLVGLVYTVAGVGVMAAFFAPVLLGPSPEERAAQLQQHARQLAERNRLARELHDSVGHALSIVSVQAAAATTVLDHNPTFARDALTAIQTAAARALDDLDHVLGLLRDNQPAGSDRLPHPTGAAEAAGPAAPTLAELDALLATTRPAGLTVNATVTGPTGRVPAAVSRETYRIIQEGLTNALRHAGAVTVTLQLTVNPDQGTLDLTLTSPLRGEPTRGVGSGGGRGLAGIRERVTVLGGQVTAGASEHNTWRLHARLPLGSPSP